MPHPIACLALSMVFFASVSALAEARSSTPAAHSTVPATDAPPLEPQISAYVREVFQARDGSYWFGTNDEGVCRHDGTSLRFFGRDQGLAGVAIRGIAQGDDGSMWFATDAGVSRLLDDSFTNFTVHDGLSDDGVWSLLRDRSGTIWAGTQEGVCRFDGVRFVPFALPRVAVEAPESRFTPKVVFAMHQDRNGSIWFGTDGEGVHRLDGEGFTSYTAKDGLGGNMVRSICEDRQGRIWVGSDGGGVTCFDGSALRTFTTKDGLGNDRVFEILADRAGNLWFSTLGAGVCRYDGVSFTPFGAAEGLSLAEVPCACGSGKRTKECHGSDGAHVQDLFEDRDGRLWAGCSGGLFRLEGSSFVNITRAGPWPALAPRNAGDQTPAPPPAPLAAPLASLARMLGGEWRVTFANGTTQFDRWSPGPGGHSVSSQTFGTDAAGNPWRSLSVLYWHPGRGQVCALGLHPDVPGVGRGHSEGVLAALGEEVSVRLHLQQSGAPGRTRKLENRSVFDGPDTYRSTLLEDSGNGYTPLVAWDYARSRDLSAEPPVAAEASRPSGHLGSLEPLLAHAWEGEGVSADGGPFHVRTTFEWIPYIEVVVARTALVAADGEATLLLEAYVHRSIGADTLRVLALSSDGTVHEGELTIAEGGGMEVDLLGHGTKAHGAEQGVLRRARVEIEEGATLRARVWTESKEHREPRFDVQHRKQESDQR